MRPRLLAQAKLHWSLSARHLPRTSTGGHQRWWMSTRGWWPAWLSTYSDSPTLTAIPHQRLRRPLFFVHPSLRPALRGHTCARRTSAPETIHLPRIAKGRICNQHEKDFHIDLQFSTALGWPANTAAPEWRSNSTGLICSDLPRIISHHFPRLRSCCPPAAVRSSFRLCASIVPMTAL